MIEVKKRVLAGARSLPNKETLSGAFFWLSAFYFVYCARPEDWFPGLAYVPLAKITGFLALAALLFSLGRAKRSFRDLPREGHYLLALIGLMILSALLSPVWRAGALVNSLNFSKVYIVWFLTVLVVNEFQRLRRLIFIQTASVVLICIVSLAKGHSQPRLEGVLGGIYSNPNDLAFAIVLSLPFALAFLVSTPSLPRKVAWLVSMLFMLVAVFFTASRGGFITLVVAGAVCLWQFGVKGRRFYLIAGAALLGSVLLLTVGRHVLGRFAAISGEVSAHTEDSRAYESFEQRRFLMVKALEGIAHYPILGVGNRNFEQYSTVWREVHMTYLQIAVEGGLPAAIFYLMFFSRGFQNLKKMRQRKDTDPNVLLFVWALQSSLVGFVVGALFAPEAYQFFPYFTVAYTSALALMSREHELSPQASLVGRDWRSRRWSVGVNDRKSGDLTHVR